MRARFQQPFGSCVCGADTLCTFDAQTAIKCDGEVTI